MSSIALLAARHDIHTVRWVNGLSSRGHDVHLLSMHDYGDPLKPEVTFHHLPIPTNAGYFLNAPIARRTISKLQPDLVHAHYASGYGTLGRLVGYRPYVLSVWGRDVYEVPYKSVLHNKLVESNLLAADKICSTSQVMADQTLSIASLDASPTVTPFGIDTTRFSPNEEAAGRGADIIIGTVKRLRSKYGVDVLIDAFARLRQRLIENGEDAAHKLRLRIVGDGCERKYLKELARKKGLGKVTTFVGRVAHENVPTELNNLDVYVALSRNESESFGVAVLEASACEVPVVTSDVGGLPEVVDDGVTGTMVPKEDPEAAADALSELVLDRTLRERMGRAGRKMVQEKYEWDVCVSKMEQIYEEVLAAA